MIVCGKIRKLTRTDSGLFCWKLRVFSEGVCLTLNVPSPWKIASVGEKGRGSNSPCSHSTISWAKIHAVTAELHMPRVTHVQKGTGVYTVWAFTSSSIHITNRLRRQLRTCWSDISETFRRGNALWLFSGKWLKIRFNYAQTRVEPDKVMKHLKINLFLRLAKAIGILISLTLLKSIW